MLFKEWNFTNHKNSMKMHSIAMIVIAPKYKVHGHRNDWFACRGFVEGRAYKYL